MRAELEFRRAALPLLPADTFVLAAVSGGADSVALLHLLTRLAERRPLRLAVAHLDHGLRRGSAADRRFVERMAAALRLPCVSDRRPVASLRRKGESPEEAARRVRRAFLLEAMEGVGADRIALGHTLDDQAETVLLRFARGSGPSSLMGMSPDGPGPFVRPLLTVERTDLRSFLARHRIAFRSDPTNRSLRFDRNRVRRLVLPMLAETLNPRVARHLVAAAQRLRDDALWLDAQAVQDLATIARSGGAGRTLLDASRLAGLPVPLRRRVAWLSIARACGDPRRVTSRHVEALLTLATAPNGKSLDLPGGLTASKRKTTLLLARPPGDDRTAC